MKWFHSRKKYNVPQRIDKLFSDLKKDFLRILLVLDQRGVNIYAIAEDSFFREEDTQALLNLFRLSEKLVTESINENSLVLLKKLLQYEVSSINVKFGTFRLWLVKSDKYYLIAVTDEAINSVNIRHFEDLLHKKLRELEDLRIIETYD